MAEQKMQSLIPQEFNTTASSNAGESILMRLDEGEDGLENVDESVFNPFKEFGLSFLQFFKNIGGIFKNPKALVFSIILAGIWLVLIILKTSGVAKGFVNFASWLTFAQGGMSGGFFGYIGGILGKVFYTTALFRLISGAKGLGNGFKQLFKPFKSFRNIGPVLIGIGIAMICYNFFGAKITFEDSMVAILGFFLAVSSLGSESGFLFRMARSFMARKANGNRVADISKTNGILTGIAIGSILNIPLSAGRFGFFPLIFGFFFFLIPGIILYFVLREKIGGQTA